MICNNVLMKKVLISACLLGENVRYNAEIVPVDERIKDLGKRYDLIACCPELEGGLTVPRDPCEIFGDGGGEAVLRGEARVLGKSGKDCTAEFIKGSAICVLKAFEEDVEFAILKQRSPSCGSSIIYSGKFDGERTKGEGVLCTALRKAGIKVLSEEEL